MLKTSVIDSRKRRRLVLDGMPTGARITVLRTAWNAANVNLQDRQLVVDLWNVIFYQRRGPVAAVEQAGQILYRWHADQTPTPTTQAQN